MATATQTSQPKWLRSMIASRRAGEAHVFTLTGDVRGYVPSRPGITPVAALADYLLAPRADGSRRIVVRFSRASGIEFLIPSGTPDEAAATVRETYQNEADRLLTLAATAGKGAAPAPQSQGAAAGAMAALTAMAQGQQGQPAASGEWASVRRLGPALDKLETLLLAQRDAVAVVIDYADLLLPDAPASMTQPEVLDALVRILTWANDTDRLGAMGNPVILVARDAGDLHKAIRAADSGLKALTVDLPTRAERAAYIAWYLRAAEDDGEPLAIADGLTAEELANTTAGLSLRHVENVILLSRTEDRGLTRAQVKLAKDEIINSEFSDVAEMLEPLEGGFAQVGGMDNLVAWAEAEVIGAVREGRQADMPKGVLLVGPPGTGKTWLARALAREVGFNAVALNMSKVLGGIVGESEKKMARFWAFVRALTPCLVFVDEIDQTEIGSRGNGSGNPVAKNLFNSMLQFMSDETNRGRVLVLMASNRPDLLDSALLRSGRMDAIIPVLLPTRDARVGIVAAQARMQGAAIATPVAEWLADHTDQYNAGDLAAIVTKARKLAERAGVRGVLALEHVERAHGMLKPSTKDARYYTDLAIAACNDTEFLPPAEAKLLENRADLDARIYQETAKRRRGSDL